MLGEEHLRHLITDEQRQRFEADGYLRVPGALSPALVAELLALVDQIYAEHRQRGFDPYTGKAFAPKRAFFFPNFLPRDQRFVNLLDWPPILPLMWGLLGWNIYNYHTHLIVTPPRDPGDPQTARLNFHQDSGRVNQELESSPRPRLSIKVAYWLTDLSVPGRGNLYVIPGSHLHDRIELPADDQLAQGILPADAVPICCAPGDAVVFDRRIWHAASPNDSDMTRKALFYGYGYRWLRPKDDMTISQEMLARNDPIRRQLMGDGVDANGHFSPTDADVPLKGWLAANGLPV